MNIRRLLMILLVAIAMNSNLYPQQSNSAFNWDGWNFFLGEWIGKGGGQPGQGSGGFSFSFDIQKRVIVRKNYADYPATKDRPAFSHNDLMVIYKESGDSTRAIYWDNEGHIIHYTVSMPGDTNSVTFLSDLKTSEPRYRLTYTKADDKSVKITFEIASPRNPETFLKYIESEATRK
jgi:hypothetical protein